MGRFFSSLIYLFFFFFLGLPESEISAHWPVFCSIIQSVAKKTIVATAEEAATAREQRKQKNQSTDAITRGLIGNLIFFD